jgi:hypothetical protein
MLRWIEKQFSEENWRAYVARYALCFLFLIGLGFARYALSGIDIPFDFGSPTFLLWLWSAGILMLLGITVAALSLTIVLIFSVALQKAGKFLHPFGRVLLGALTAVVFSIGLTLLYCGLALSRFWASVATDIDIWIENNIWDDTVSDLIAMLLSVPSSIFIITVQAALLWAAIKLPFEPDDEPSE